jgi:hypothetical protein
LSPQLSKPNPLVRVPDHEDGRISIVVRGATPSDRGPRRVPNPLPRRFPDVAAVSNNCLQTRTPARSWSCLRKIWSSGHSGNQKA